MLTRATAATDALGSLLIGLAPFGVAAFVAGQIASLEGVAEADAGLASGVEETTFAVGGGLGSRCFGRSRSSAAGESDQ